MAASTDANVAANWTAYTGNTKKYRGIATVLMGSSTGGTATTTWTDQDATFDWDNTKTLSFVGSNCVLNWGKKVGSGVEATGRNGIHAFFGAATTLSQRHNIYGGTLTAVGVNNFLAIVGDASSEYIDCIIGTTGTGVNTNIRLGSGSTPTGSFYNCDFWGNASGATASIFSIFNPTLMSRGTCGGNAMGAQLRLTNQSALALRDMIFFGAPSVADLVIVSSFGSGKLVRPKWSGGTKLSSATTIPAGNLPEYWAYDPRVQNVAGTPVAGISVKVTDVLGNVLVNTVTDSNGRITYDSGISLNTVPVIDHYITGGVYLTRARGPFVFEYNTVNQNMTYPKHRQILNWPQDANGAFEDHNPAVSLLEALSPPGWAESVVDQ